MRSEAIGAAHRIKSGVLGRKYIHIGIADQGGLGRLDVGFTKQHARAEWIGLLGFEAVAAVHLKEKWIHCQRIDNCSRRPNRFIAEHRHLAWKSFGRGKSAQRFEYAVIYVRVVELVLAVVIQEELQGNMDEVFVLGIAKSAPHQHGSAIPDVTADHFKWQFVTTKMSEHGVDGIAEILPRIDKGSIEIKNQQPQFPYGNLTIDLHYLSVYLSRLPVQHRRAWLRSSAA